MKWFGVPSCWVFFYCETIWQGDTWISNALLSDLLDQVLYRGHPSNLHSWRWEQETLPWICGGRTPGSPGYLTSPGDASSVGERWRGEKLEPRPLQRDGCVLNVLRPLPPASQQRDLPLGSSDGRGMCLQVAGNLGVPPFSWYRDDQREGNGGLVCLFFFLI